MRFYYAFIASFFVILNSVAQIKLSRVSLFLLNLSFWILILQHRFLPIFSSLSVEAFGTLSPFGFFFLDDPFILCHTFHSLSDRFLPGLTFYPNPSKP